MQGWIKLHRALLTNELWVKEPFTKGQAWVDMLLRINHKDNKGLVGNQSIEILKGQTLWSMKDMASRWRWSRKKVGNFLKMLKKEHQIDYKSTTKYTIITVINWELYQNEIQEGTSNIDEKNIKGTSKEHQKNTNKNDKNVKNEKKNNYMSNSNEYRLAEYLYKHILKNNPKTKEPNLQNWAKIFDYILRIDKRELDEVKTLIVFCQEHAFWYKNILSPDKLRKQYDRLVLEMNGERGKDKKSNCNDWLKE
ncbi:Replication protein O [Clostridium botulinum]|uniref:hypothetical protein n=1 Tax=Clostridium botulinum TaxID=1491 RepID=UPI001969D168|nr:hypothetical protein [Clostridium botulinum]MBN3348312.1 Replication protein O [Clostridium botulinum]